MPVQSRSQESTEERVTPLELFFDLIFVFAITQVTGFVVADPTWGGLVRGPARARCALVVLGRVRLADEHDQPRGGHRPDRDVRGDGGDADRIAGRAGRLRRRRVPLRVRLRGGSDRSSGAVRRRRPRRPRSARGRRAHGSRHGSECLAPLRRGHARRQGAGDGVGGGAARRPAGCVHRRRQGLASCAQSLRRAPRPDRDHRARRVDRRPRPRCEPSARRGRDRGCGARARDRRRALVGVLRRRRDRRRAKAARSHRQAHS